MQKVYCFFEELGFNPDAHWLLCKWAANWKAHGFDPAVLTEADCMAHPRFRHLSAIFEGMPSVNPKGYDRACMIRWCAMAVFGGIMTDYDLFNLSFKPISPGELTFYERNRVPCIVSGTPGQFERLLVWLEDYANKPAEDVDGRSQKSDMYCFSVFHPEAKTLDTCRQYPDLSGETVHVSNDSCGGDKRKAIESFMP